MVPWGAIAQYPRTAVRNEKELGDAESGRYRMVFSLRRPVYFETQERVLGTEPENSRNFLSEAYVTFFWLPMTHLPHDVYKTTGWLADLGVSGVFQFMVLAQFIALIGLSIQEMFVHRFKVVVIHQSNGFYMKIPKYSINVYRFLTLIHLLSITWISIDSQTLIYQQEKKDELFRTIPDLAKDIGCYTVFILAPKDPFLIGNVAIWGVLLIFGTIATFSSVYFINQFLKTARNISNETKKLQRMLIVSLVGQATIHAVLIIFPVFMQIYQIIFIFYDNNFATMLLFFIAYHGFFSTCAMVYSTKQLREKVLKMFCCLWKNGSRSQVRGNSTVIGSTHVQ
ncbi:unnamed protein product [Caenorhabditis brenneri]